MKKRENNVAYIDGANLYKGAGAPIAYLSDKRSILQTQKEKAPDADKTA